MMRWEKRYWEIRKITNTMEKSEAVHELILKDGMILVLKQTCFKSHETYKTFDPILHGCFITGSCNQPSVLSILLPDGVFDFLKMLRFFNVLVSIVVQ